MRRETLLSHNSGDWQGCFIRCDGRGLEQERFKSQLSVQDQGGKVVAALTNVCSGQVRSMNFAEPPAEMQISPQGHWSLGPDRIGAWPWVSELCLVWGERRRRAVIRHGSERLESLVVVSEAKPGMEEPLPPAPLQALASPAPASAGLIWSLPAALGVTLQTADRRQSGVPEEVALCWQPEPGIHLEIRRRYSAYGALESWGATAAGTLALRGL
ncbi:DUF3598 family protein [Cyanobium sp. L1E-Cus]|uniref:DUF3598 family protein n=1 Tax=Cyanobium sp. L1E-Cus TaxID=2823714 RepID=UPI0020CE2421|nr:DUF3598 family protein [Cyanobium sp. L1E-Cus]MCP9821463.1 DUF3598 family protein [Cyanobium sp. L1E-Cus]